MKTRLSGWIRTGWRVLTEVPGWPDAPAWVRMRRAMPVVFPCMAMVLLLDWNIIYHAPRVHDQHAALQPLLDLQEEIAALNLMGSAQQKTELADRAAEASRLLLDSPAELPGLLRTLKKEAADRGWDASFVASDPASSPAGMHPQVGYLPVRAKMVPQATNEEAFNSFLAVMNRFSSLGKRIDLIRLSVRADEHRWHLVELNFRVGYPLLNAKTP